MMRSTYCPLLLVDLNYQGENTKQSVHRLVLLAFRGEPKIGEVACHNNGDPKDCRLENLRWDSYSANVEDCRKHGRLPLGEKNKTSILTEKQVHEIRAALKSPYRGIVRDLGQKYGVVPEAISSIRHGKNSKWLGQEAA